jgi:peptidoglycan lytic transglycosylase
VRVRSLIPVAVAAATLVPVSSASAQPVITKHWRSSIASWYGPCPDACGRAACTGKFITKFTYGVAHKTLPCGTRLTICRKRRCIHVKVIDRGPFVAGRDLDITIRAARKIGLTPSVGIMRVRWRRGFVY